MTIDTPFCFAIGLITGVIYNITPSWYVLTLGFIAFLLLCVILIRVRMREIRAKKIRNVFDLMGNNSDWAQHKHD